MTCPWCDFEGSPRALHAHFGASHPEAVRFEERGGKRFYGIECPVCGAGYDHQIKPRGRDPGFVDEFSEQIRLVAFDMLVNHLLAEHEEIEVPDEEAPETPAASEADAPGPSAPVGEGGPAWLVEARRQAAAGRQGPGSSDSA